MKLTAPYIWIMTSGIYDVLQIWDQDGSASYFDIYANGVKVYTLDKDDDISYVTIEDLNLARQCEPSHGYNIGVIGYDSDGNSTEDSNEVCWYSDGEFDNDGADPDIIAPFKVVLNIQFFLDRQYHGMLKLDNYFLSEDGSIPNTSVVATRNSYINGVTVTFSGSQIKTVFYDYKIPIDKVVTTSVSSLNSGTNYTKQELSVYASSSSVTRYKFHRYIRGTDIVDVSVKAHRYGDFTPPTDCIAFVSDVGNFTLRAYKSWDGTVEYSTDRITWMIWDGSAILSAAQKLYLRGYGNTDFFSNYIGSHFLLSAHARCYGNINTLLQYDEPPMSIPTNKCYDSMFKGCTGLIQAPELPATTLSSGCYNDMFYGCTSLTQVPELPATTLTFQCYSSMFYGCTSLTQVPELPATTLSSGCYNDMFYGCTSLTQVPELPATTLSDGCYDSMFYGCTKIKMSDTRTGTYTQPYRIPTSGTGKIGYNSLFQMFYNTGGKSITPEINTTYYLHSSNTVV